VATASSCWWHNDEISFSGAFDSQVAVELAELEKLFVVHLHERRSADNQRRLLDWFNDLCHAI
jgi:hypothetical protein